MERLLRHILAPIFNNRLFHTCINFLDQVLQLLVIYSQLWLTLTFVFLNALTTFKCLLSYAVVFGDFFPSFWLTSAPAFICSWPTLQRVSSIQLIVVICDHCFDWHLPQPLSDQRPHYIVLHHMQLLMGSFFNALTTFTCPLSHANVNGVLFY